MAAGGDAPFATDLRRLTAADPDAVRGASRQRFGSSYAELNPMEAYDVIVHLPHVTAADPDPEAVAAWPSVVATPPLLERARAAGRSSRGARRSARRGCG